MINGITNNCEKKSSRRLPLTLGFIVILFIFIVLPQLFILKTGLNFSNQIEDDFGMILGNSFGIAFIVALASCLLAFLCALFLVYSNIKFKKIYYAICISPMMIPPISYGLGLLYLFGRNGTIYQLFGYRFTIMGFNGIIIGQIFYTFPPSLMLIINGIRKTDIVLYEQSSTDGSGFVEYVRMILLPHISKILFYVFILNFSMSISDYTIALVIGGRVKTLSLSIYRLAVGVLNISKAARIGVILLWPVILMVTLNHFIIEYDYSTSYDFKKAPTSSLRDSITYILLTIICSIICLLFLSIIYMSFVKSYPLDKSITFDNFIKALSGKYLKMLFNSLYVSLGTAILGSTVAFIAAYISFKEKNILIKKICQTVSFIPRAIPGILFGIGYAMIFYKTPLKSTFFLLILGCVFHFLTIPYTIAYNGFSSMSSDYWDLELLYGLGFTQSLKFVYIPYMKNILIDMFYYLFSNTMISISVAVFLASYNTMPYSLILNNFEGSIEYFSNCSAVIVVILMINLFLNYLIRRE